jgi:hypothetical protein
MTFRRTFLLLPLFAAPALAQQVAPPAAGGPPAGRVEGIGRDAGPANHPPLTDTPDAVNRGTDGSATGLQAPAATGTTPQGFLGSSTAGARQPAAPIGGAPEQSRPPR